MATHCSWLASCSLVRVTFFFGLSFGFLNGVWLLLKCVINWLGCVLFRVLIGYLSCVLGYFGLKACLQMLRIKATVGLTGLICVLVGLGFIVWHLDVGLSFGYFGLSLGNWSADLIELGLCELG